MMADDWQDISAPSTASTNDWQDLDSGTVNLSGSGEADQSKQQHGNTPPLQDTATHPFGLQAIKDAYDGKNDIIGRISNPSELGRIATQSAGEAYHGIADPIAQTGEVISGQRTPTWRDAPGLIMPFIPGAELPNAARKVGLAGEALTKVPGAVADIATSPVRAASTIHSGWNALKPEELQSTVSDLQKGTNGVYTQMRNLGAGAGDPEAARSAVNNALTRTDILPKLTPVTSDVVQQINDAADTGNISLNHLDQFRRQLRNASGEDSAAAGAVRKAIDNHVNSITDETGDPNAVALLNRGRAEFTRNANLDDVGTILQKSNGDPTKIKNQLNTFLADEDNTRGMLPDEIAALRRASKTSTPEMLTKMLGKAGFTLIPTNAQGNGVLPYVMMAGEMTGKTGAGAMVPGGLPLVAAGTAAKAANTLYGRGLGQKAFDLIKNRQMPPLPEDTNIAGALESPPIRTPSGGFQRRQFQGEAQGPEYQPQRLLGGNDYSTIPSRTLTYQPRADYEVTPEGWTSPTSNTSIRQETPTAEQLRNAKIQTSKTSSKAPFKQLTYQPRPDFIATDSGIVQATPNEQAGNFGLGEAEGLPIGTPGELSSVRKNPRYPQKRGGAIKKPKTGVIWAKPKRYPALDKMRSQ